MKPRARLRVARALRRAACALCGVILSLHVSCSPVATWPDGTYRGTADGFGGRLTAEVIIRHGQITRVHIIRHAETPGLADAAMEKIPTRILERQNPEVDAVSGATRTSNAIIEAVKKALPRSSR